MSVLAPASSIKRDRQIERGQTEWKGWPQNSFFCLVVTWYAIKNCAQFEFKPLNIHSFINWSFENETPCFYLTLVCMNAFPDWFVSCQLFSFNFAENKQTFMFGFCTVSVWSKCSANWSAKFATQHPSTICKSCPCCVRRRRAWHRVWPLVPDFRPRGDNGMIFGNNSSSFCLILWILNRYIISNGGDTILSQRKDILHEKWGIILQHCYYRLAINANLIYTLHTLCIEEYNKK